MYNNNEKSTNGQKNSSFSGQQNQSGQSRPQGNSSSSNNNRSNYNNSNPGQRQNNNNNRNRQRRRMSRPTNNTPMEMRAKSVETAHYMVRKDDATVKASLAGALSSLNPVKKIKETSLGKGNLAISHLNATLSHGIEMQTNSPKTFPVGNKVKIIPIGGVNEVGMNMTALKCGDDIVVIDTGFGFGGGDRFPGVDFIIPDTSYLEQNKHKIRGIIYTHGHLDHIGGAPYILPKLGEVPIYSMPLTLALLKNRLQEFEMQNKFQGKIIELDKPLTLGAFTFHFFRLNHSVPDVVGLGIDTPMGRIVYCTDWKFDNTPFDGQLSDYGKIAHLGDEGVRLLLTDSLGILKPGYAISEADIEKTMMNIFKQAQGRVIVTTFSTTIARIQHVINSCIKFNRKLTLIGRSMVNNFNVCSHLGYIKVPPGLVLDIRDAEKLAPEKVCVLSTGSQGEDNAALARMAKDEHPMLRLQGGDSVLFSSKPIPGNEDSVQNLIAQLSRKGVEVFMHKEFDLHVSGHACHEDLKLLFSLSRPDYLMPIHGDHFMLRKVCELGVKMGIPFEHNLLVENNRIIELTPNSIEVTEQMVGEGFVLVDGTGVGSVSELVLEERRQMATQGSLMMVLLVNKSKKLVGGPEIISRGFVYMKSTTSLFDEMKEVIRKEFNGLDLDPTSKTYWADLRNQLRNATREFIYYRTEKDPVIIPVVIQV